MKTIAVIDDDVYIGDMLEEVLRKEGYGVLRAYSGSEALFLLKEHRPDLILLDLMLPGLSGEELLPQIHSIPTIVVSAKTNTSNKVNLLLNGACDYVTKPFDVNELLARILVQFRNQQSTMTGDLLEFEMIKLNQKTHEVRVNDTNVHLTRTEYAILRLLMLNPHQVVTKSALLEDISQDTPDCMESSLKIHIFNLRKKLKEISGHDYIEAVWGIGFKLCELDENVTNLTNS